MFKKFRIKKKKKKKYQRKRMKIEQEWKGWINVFFYSDSYIIHHLVLWI